MSWGFGPSNHQERERERNGQAYVNQMATRKIRLSAWMDRKRNLSASVKCLYAPIRLSAHWVNFTLAQNLAVPALACSHKTQYPFTIKHYIEDWRSREQHTYMNGHAKARA